MFKIGDTLVCTETNSVQLSANSVTTGEEYVVTGLWEGGVHIVNDDGEVEEEDEDSVSLVGDDSAMRKPAFDFYRLGEKINFK